MIFRCSTCVIDDKSNPGDTDRRPATSAFNERLIAEGCWVFAGGMRMPTRPRSSTTGGEQAVFSDGAQPLGVLFGAFS
jgi:hypothetical protein